MTAKNSCKRNSLQNAEKNIKKEDNKLRRKKNNKIAGWQKITQEYRR